MTTTLLELLDDVEALVAEGHHGSAAAAVWRCQWTRTPCPRGVTAQSRADFWGDVHSRLYQGHDVSEDLRQARQAILEAGWTES